jgi:predicted dehydrogenase
MKVALLGNGWIARNAHMPSFKAFKEEGVDIELAAICDVNPERLNNDLNACGYTDFDELLKNEKDLDMVLICLPTFLHAEYAIKAMKSGLHVLCEKPMALTEADCDKMIACAKETGKRLMVAHCCRFTDERRIMKKYVDEEILGKPVSAFFSAADGAPDWGWENWFADGNRSGGCMLDLQAHHIDLLNWFFGAPDYTSTMAKEVPDFTGYGSISANMGWNNGFYAHIWSDWGMTYNIHNKRFIRINFEKGYIYQDMNQKPFFVEVRYEDRKTTDLITERTIKVSDYRAELEYFVDCVKNNQPFDICPPEDSKLVMRVMRAQEKSADQKGATVSIAK